MVDEAELIRLMPELEPFASREWQAERVSVSSLAGDRAEQIRKAYRDVAHAVCVSQAPSRTRSIALTELETSMMFAIKGLYS